ncbi:MAG: hypothetical protein CMJ49_04545 [Planctomycetaceae bacterium]|nr:hypothetical protein [Planctomycetaceae bacterium]
MTPGATGDVEDALAGRQIQPGSQGGDLLVGGSIIAMRVEQGVQFVESIDVPGDRSGGLVDHGESRASRGGVFGPLDPASYDGRMPEAIIDSVANLMDRGGWVIWPLLVLSIVALTLIFERTWFWIATNSQTRRVRFDQVALCLRQGAPNEARALASGDRSVYGRLMDRLLGETSASAIALAVEDQRQRLERFMTTLGTIITAAPMLGILGTVTGIIRSFNVLGAEVTATEPSQVAIGIAEALITTVVGLAIALVVLFPYNVFRAQLDRSLGRMETLIAAVQEHHGAESAANSGDDAEEKRSA